MGLAGSTMSIAFKADRRPWTGKRFGALQPAAWRAVFASLPQKQARRV